MNKKRILKILDRVRPTISNLKGRKISQSLINDMNRAAGVKCFQLAGRAIVLTTPTAEYEIYNGYDAIAEYNSYGKIVGNNLFPALFDHLRKKIG